MNMPGNAQLEGVSVQTQRGRQPSGRTGTLHLISLNLAKELSHGVCVSNLCVRVARELKLPEDTVHQLAVAGFLHDIGKLQLEKYIYGNEDTLTVEEMRLVRMHADLSAQILKAQGYPEDIIEWVHCHHENCDGSGYPRHLHSQDIPLEARIIRVCDVFAALTADRLYRKAFDVDTAVDMMISEERFYDLRVFLAFLRVVHSDGLEKLLDREETEERFAVLLGPIPVLEGTECLPENGKSPAEENCKIDPASSAVIQNGCLQERQTYKKNREET